MALYHFSVRHVSRGKGQMVVASAAYISGQRIFDSYYNKIHDYTSKSGVIFTEILTPEYVPERLNDRETLWNEVEHGERLNPIFYLETGEGAGFGGNEYTSEAAQRLLNEAARYLGTPYVWGGYSPSGFDCSGFVSYCLTHSGVRNTGRLTAQGLYDICTPVSQSEAQPGDLIFFTGTYDAGVPVTHIGIYVGNGQMIHCGHPVQYTSINSPYWQSHFYGFGRW